MCHRRARAFALLRQIKKLFYLRYIALTEQTEIRYEEYDLKDNIESSFSNGIQCFSHAY